MHPDDPDLPGMLSPTHWILGLGGRVTVCGPIAPAMASACARSIPADSRARAALNVSKVVPFTAVQARSGCVRHCNPLNGVRRLVAKRRPIPPPARSPLAECTHLAAQARKLAGEWTERQERGQKSWSACEHADAGRRAAGSYIAARRRTPHGFERRRREGSSAQSCLGALPSGTPEARSRTPQRPTCNPFGCFRSA